MVTEDALIGKDSSDSGAASFYGEVGTTYYIQFYFENAEYAGDATVSIVTADQESDYFDLYIGDVEVANKDSVDTKSFPDGATFDSSSRTLTLSNCTIDVSDNEFATTYLSCSYLSNIVLEGNNLFTGLSYSNVTGILATGDITISGTGSLTIDLSKADGAAIGIKADTRLTIDGPTIDIVSGGEPNTQMFYGITTDPWHGYSKYRNAKDEFYVKITNAHINIQNENANTYNGRSIQALNMGIDTQDCDLSIQNSDVQIALTGGYTWGIGSGLWKQDVMYGGKLSVDAASHVKIALTDPCESYQNMGYIWSVYYGEDNVQSKYIYAGPAEGQAVLSDKSCLRKHVAYPWSTARNECTDYFLELSPTEIGGGGQVTPEPQVVRGDVTGDGDVTVTDILKINRHLLGRGELSADELAAADVTGDGDVTVTDILKINRFLLGRDAEL